MGNTLNTASRIEAHGLPDAIQLSEVAYALLCDQYVFEEHGRIEVKGKGEMQTYLLQGRNELVATSKFRVSSHQEHAQGCRVCQRWPWGRSAPRGRIMSFKT